MKSAASLQIVTFRLGDDLFAAGISDVERVLRYAAPTPVPNVPDWVKGVIEYRSRVVPVIDLRERFGLEAADVDGATRLMVLAADGEWVAAVVDAVLEVVALGASQLAEPPALFRGLAGEFLRGILRRGERLVIVLDVARLLATHDHLSFDVGALASASLGAISIGNGAADLASDSDVAGPPVDDAGAAVEPASTMPSPTDGPTETAGGSPVDPGGQAPSDAGRLELVGPEEEAPRPDASILGEEESDPAAADDASTGTDDD